MSERKVRVFDREWTRGELAAMRETLSSDGWAHLLVVLADATRADTEDTIGNLKCVEPIDFYRAQGATARSAFIVGLAELIADKFQEAGGTD